MELRVIFIEQELWKLNPCHVWGPYRKWNFSLFLLRDRGREATIGEALWGIQQVA